MYRLKLILRASTPLFILLFFRFTGTTRAEYEANFRLVQGEIKGPYVLVFENFDLVTNDSLRGGDAAYSEFTSVLHEHDLFRAYKQFSENVQSRESSWGTNLIDSLAALPTQGEWAALLTQNEGFVFTMDTVLHSEYRYPVDIPVKLGVYRSLSARVFFSLGDHKDKLQVIFPSDKRTDDPYRLKKRLQMSLAGTFHRTYDHLAAYFEQLNQFISEHSILTVKRLNTHAESGRVYKVWDVHDVLIFEDNAGLEGLEYQTNELGLIDVSDGEGDDRFILWYDHWYIYFLIAIQVLLFLGILDKVARPDEEAAIE